MSYPVMPLGFLGSQGGDNDTYQISRSLRFNSADSAYLNRTSSVTSTSTQKGTISFWWKRASLLSTTHVSNEQWIFRSGNPNTTNSFGCYIASANQLNIEWGSGPVYIVPTQVLRDPSAWYHVVFAWDTTQATASNRLKYYINGSQVTSFSTEQYVSQNANLDWMSNGISCQIGSIGGGARPLDAYLAEFNFIDGQALTPSSFGETDAITGRWKAKAYSGTYGTNGFYLNFSDNSGTTSTTLGKDSSGNSNNWTPNNFSVTAGAGNDSLVDSPTNYGSDTGLGGEVRGNYCVLNLLDKYSSISVSDGNLYAKITTQINGAGGIRGSTGVSSGKWYWEVVVGTIPPARPYLYIGVDKTTEGNISSLNNIGTGSLASSYVYLSGNKQNNNVSSAYGATFTTNDIIGVALDLNLGNLTFYKNGVSQGTAFSGLIGNFAPSFALYTDAASSPMAMDFFANFGQRPFAYTAPSGFKALCTTNLPTPVIKKPSSAMDVVTYTGNGSTQTISGLGFSPDFVWIKSRSSAFAHGLFDTIRGATKPLYSNLTNAEGSEADSLTAFNSNGFSLGADTAGFVNRNGVTHVAWSWDESAISGFDIVSYTGNGTTQNISHSLGVSPKMVIVKNRDTASTPWNVYHSGLTAGYLLSLNQTAAQFLNTNRITAVSSSNFSVGSDSDVNQNTKNHIAYCFSEIEGYSKFGSYTGNGSADGPFVYCGFRPRLVMVKRTDSTGDWSIFDTARQTINPQDLELFPNTSGAEYDGNRFFDILSNGFKIMVAAGDHNTNNSTVVFAAFAESPFKYARAR